MQSKKRDWSAYNEHRKRELSRFIRESKRVLAVVGPPVPPFPEGEHRTGRPPYDASSMFLVNLLRIYLRMSYRDVETVLKGNEQLRRKLKLPHAPGRDTIHRHAQALSEAYLREFNDALTLRLKKGGFGSAWMPRVSRSTGTQHVGALPRSTSGATAG